MVIGHHVVVTYGNSSSASGVKIYVDSILQVVTISKDNLDGTVLNTANFLMGAESHGYQLNGKMDEVVVYNYTLTPEDVAFRYNNGTGTESTNITTTTTTTTSTITTTIIAPCGSLSISSDMVIPITSQQCVNGTHVIERVANMTVGGSVCPINKTESELCAYGCDNSTNTCNEAPYMVNIKIFGGIVFILVFIIAILKVTGKI